MNREYKVNYQYFGPDTNSYRSLDGDISEIFREYSELNQELNDAVNGEETDEEVTTFKWMMSTKECSSSCGGGKKSEQTLLNEGRTLKPI